MDRKGIAPILSVALGGILTLLGAGGTLAILAVGIWGSGIGGIAHSFPLPVFALILLVLGIKILRAGIRRFRLL